MSCMLNVFDMEIVFIKGCCKNRIKIATTRHAKHDGSRDDIARKADRLRPVKLIKMSAVQYIPL